MRRLEVDRGAEARYWLAVSSRCAEIRVGAIAAAVPGHHEAVDARGLRLLDVALHDVQVVRVVRRHRVGTGSRRSWTVPPGVVVGQHRPAPRCTRTARVPAQISAAAAKQQRSGDRFVAINAQDVTFPGAARLPASGRNDIARRRSITRHGPAPRERSLHRCHVVARRVQRLQFRPASRAPQCHTRRTPLAPFIAVPPVGYPYRAVLAPPAGPIQAGVRIERARERRLCI